jgi:hypothetical protein
MLITLVLEKNTIYEHRIGENRKNSDHNIDPIIFLTELLSGVGASGVNFNPEG